MLNSVLFHLTGVRRRQYLLHCLIAFASTAPLLFPLSNSSVPSDSITPINTGLSFSPVFFVGASSSTFPFYELWKYISSTFKSTFSSPSSSSYGEESPILYKGIVLDGGSTGTRAHVFPFTYLPSACGDYGSVRISLPGRSRKVSPGIAAFASSAPSNNDAPSLEEYLSVLRDFLYQEIRDEDRPSSAIFFKGTAGMRHLHLDAQQDLIRRIDGIVKDWGFWYDKQWSVKMMDGQNEGVLGWIVLNQLLGRFPMEETFLEVEPKIEVQKENQDMKRNYFGMVEMGGASAQIVIEAPDAMKLGDASKTDAWGSLSSNTRIVPIPENEDCVKFNFCGRSYVVYSKTFLGFGRQLALQKYLQTLAEGSNESPVSVSCLPSDLLFPIPSDDDSIDENMTATPQPQEECSGECKTKRMARGIPNYDTCKKDLSADVHKLPKLPFKLPATFELFATENFYYFNQYVMDSKGMPTMTADGFAARAKELCALPSTQVAKIIHPDAAKEKAETACFGLLFMSEFLTHTLNIPGDKEVRAVNEVTGVDILWAAGVLLFDMPRLLKMKTFEEDIVTPLHPPPEAYGHDEL